MTAGGTIARDALAAKRSSGLPRPRSVVGPAVAGAGWVSYTKLKFSAVQQRFVAVQRETVLAMFSEIRFTKQNH